MNDNWTTVVDPLPREEAEMALAAWLESQSVRRIVRSKDDIREDVILSKDRITLFRFMAKDYSNT